MSDDELTIKLQTFIAQCITLAGKLGSLHFWGEGLASYWRSIMKHFSKDDVEFTVEYLILGFLALAMALLFFV